MSSGERQLTPRVVGEHLGAGLCAYGLAILFWRNVHVISYDYWHVPTYVFVMLAWAVAGLFVSRNWLPTVVYAACVFVAISHCQTFALSWPGPGTKARQILDVLQRDADSHDAAERRT